MIEQTLIRSLKCKQGLTGRLGFSEDVRNLWVWSINHSVSVHEAMTNLFGIKVTTSDQHVEIGPKRMLIDTKDHLTFYRWLENRNPFNMEDEHLYSLSSGLVSIKGQDEVNPEDAEIVGAAIHETLDNLAFTKVKIKRKMQLKSLYSLTDSVKMPGEKAVQLNPANFLARLATAAQREENVEEYFEYEMTNYSVSIFKDNMRKPDKASLQKIILPEEIQNPNKNFTGTYLLDGGVHCYIESPGSWG